MKKIFLFFFMILNLAPIGSWAKVQLIFWKSEANAPRIVLPRLENETPEQAVSRYRRALEENPGLASLRPENFQLELGQALDLPAEKAGGKVRMAFIANWFQDLTPDGARIQRNISRFASAGAEPYVVGLAADLGLSSQDAIDFRDQVAKNFSLLVSLGGDDISPEVYGEKTTFARNNNIVRDQSELALVKYFKKTSRGIFFGICRGHQMGAVADGHSLHQDLSKTGVGSTSYHINSRGTNSSEMQTWHHIVFQDSLLARFLLGKHSPDAFANYTAQVNSVHHQAVNPKDTAGSYVIALDDKDATVEGLQGKNRKSLSVQFHPEFPAEVSGDAKFSSQGFQIIKGIVTYSRLNRSRGGAPICGAVHSY